MALRLAIGVVDRKPRARACAWDDEALDLREEEVGLVIDRPDRFVDLAPILRNDPAPICGASRPDRWLTLSFSRCSALPGKWRRAPTGAAVGPTLTDLFSCCGS